MIKDNLTEDQRDQQREECQRKGQLPGARVSKILREQFTDLVNGFGWLPNTAADVVRVRAMDATQRR